MIVAPFKTEKCGVLLRFIVKAFITISECLQCALYELNLPCLIVFANVMY